MITVREARAQDVQAIVTLVQQLAESIHETSQITIDSALSYLTAHASQVLLAEKGKQVVGLLSYSTRPDLYHAGVCCMIEELVVLEESRNLGIGGALLDRLFQQAHENGWAEVSVSVMPDNLGALRFYQQHGMEDEAVLLEKHF